MHCDTQLLRVNTMHADMYAMPNRVASEGSSPPPLVISLQCHLNPKTYNVIGTVIFLYKGD